MDAAGAGRDARSLPRPAAGARRQGVDVRAARDGGPAAADFESSDVTIYQADAREAWRWLPEHSADAIVTSPPYLGLRDYGVDGQIGLEDDPAEYVGGLADLLTGYARVLKPAGSLWLNLGDTYASNGGAGGRMAATGLDSPQRASLPRPEARDPERFGRWNKDYGGFPNKCLLMIPERVALALVDRGWILRNKVVWAKPNGMPSSVRDRLATKWEYLFHLVRQPRYFYDLDAIREPLSDWSKQALEGRWSRKTDAKFTDDRNDASYVAAGRNYAEGINPAGANPGDVWQIPTQPYPEAHFAVFPPALVRRPILATVPEQVCRECGRGRERIIEESDRKYSMGEAATDHQKLARTQGGVKRFRTPTGHVLPSKDRITTGWSDCGCGAGWAPGTVLDPFFGSGTTAAMARRLGRKSVGVELNPDYCALAAARFRQDVLDFSDGAV